MFTLTTETNNNPFLTIQKHKDHCLLTQYQYKLTDIIGIEVKISENHRKH